MVGFKEEHLQFDVVVAGGGMTGLCAAIASARHGAKTALVQDRPVLGGNASSEIRMHICGASASMQKSELSEGGIVHELMLRNKRVNDNYNFSIWDAVLFSAAKQEKNLTLFLNTAMHSAQREGSRIARIFCYQLTTEKQFVISGKIFMDCTGNGTLGAFVGAEYATGSEAKDAYGEPHAPEKPNKNRMGNTLLFKAADMGRPVRFVPPVDAMHFTEEQLKYRKHTPEVPDNVLEKASAEEIRMMFDGYCQDYGYWWIEIPGLGEDIVSEYEDIRDQLVRAVYGVWDHIKNGGNHGADNYELVWVGMLPGVRESRRMMGDYVLNENDVLGNRLFKDEVAYGGWYIDNHVAGGLFAYDEMPSFCYEFPGAYTIPYRAYCAKGFDNLYIGGRSMSASKLAMASARVMATCAIGGQAMGTAAAMCVRYGCDIRGIAPRMDELQQTLLRDDCYLPGLKNTDAGDFARRAEVEASSEQPGFEAINVVSGVARTIGGQSHQWRSADLNGGEAALTLSWKQPVSVHEVRITFDSDFGHDKKITLSSRRQRQQLPGVPEELVRDFDVEVLLGGAVVSARQVRGNFLRLVSVPFEGEAGDAVRIRVGATNGAAEARVFEVRVY